MSVKGVDIWWLHDEQAFLVRGVRGIYYRVKPGQTWAEREQLERWEKPTRTPLPDDLIREAWYILELPGAEPRSQRRDEAAAVALAQYASRRDDLMAMLLREQAAIAAELVTLEERPLLALVSADPWAPEPAKPLPKQPPPMSLEMHRKLAGFAERLHAEAGA